MKKTRLTLAATAAAALTAGGFWAHRQADARDAPAYRTATVERGPLEVLVSATGNLAAVRTVQVGTQVSGQVAQIEVDFNQRVTKGQLLARIDPTLARQAVADAQASLDRTQAELLAAERDHERNRQLVEEGLVSRASFDPIEARRAVARATVTSARVAVERARQNLAYTSIHAPIDGVVVERNVDVGQTVAASLSAPQLFLIANDLSRMQIVVSVDESDIAAIREGQVARFTVQARPRERFTGKVEQVRLQSTTLENIVSYGVVVSVENPEGKLLPGMTARVEFLVASADDVLKVPNAALRFRPADAPRSAAKGPQGQVWTVDGSGRLTAIDVRTGLTDGVATQVEGALQPGTKIVTGLGKADAPAAEAAARNPMQPQAGGGRGRQGGF